MSDGTLTASGAPGRQPLLRLLSDARLAKLAAQGSAPAFTAIYERHHQELYRYCRSILGNEHDARDALQNTMLKALRALDGEAREISLRPWLFRIAHNEAITLIRRRPADSSIEAAADVPATGSDPEARERLRNLITDLDQLAPRQRGALVMRELSGLEFGEIAAALDTSPAAAKQAVYEARVALLELEEGRELSCDEVLSKISAQDRRLLRGRRVRAHLKACSECRRFEQQTRERSGQLAALAPPLALPAALGILEKILGGGGGGGGIAALAGGSGGATLAGATAAKLGVAGILALGVGTVALETGSDEAPSARAAPAGRAAGSAADAQSDAAAGQSHSQVDQVSHAAGGKDGGHDLGGNSDGRANGPVSTPPGQGGTPPGQGGVPPGQGAPPPSHVGTPPGQGGVPPGQTLVPPGQGVTPPGLGGAPPPGHGGVPPGPGG